MSSKQTSRRLWPFLCRRIIFVCFLDQIHSCLYCDKVKTPLRWWHTSCMMHTCVWLLVSPKKKQLQQREKRVRAECTYSGRVYRDTELWAAQSIETIGDRRWGILQRKCVHVRTCYSTVCSTASSCSNHHTQTYCLCFSGGKGLNSFGKVHSAFFHVRWKNVFVLV